MKSTADRSTSDPLDHDRTANFDDNSSLDVPGMLAGRIGDLYASEERRRRQERTDRLMRKAGLFAQE